MLLIRPLPLVAALFVAVLTSSPARLPAAAGDVEALLAHPIIGPDVPLAEVQAYTEARVPLMPKVGSAAEWEAEADRIRRDVLEKVVFRGEAARWRDAACRVEWLETVGGGPGYSLRKLRYEALPGLWVPAILYVPDQLEGKVPVVLNVNGHDGAGKAAPYKQIRCINQAKRGMLALNVEWLGMGQLRHQNFGHYRMNQLDLCGTSGLAPFYLAMKRALDVLLAHEHADPERVAVAGLSGGGWQTIVISSLDTRVKLANPVAGYSSFRTRARHLSDLGDSEQTPSDLATVADYTHLTALMAPRGTLLTYNVKDDCCFASGHALPPLLEAAGPIFRLYGREDRLRSHVNHNPGTHNFERDNREALYRMLGDVFYGGSAEFNPSEIPSDEEVKPKAELDVELPETNNDFHRLASALCASLPRDAGLPQDRSVAANWQEGRREELARLVGFHAWDVKAQEAGSHERGETRATLWRLKIGDSWTVPAVELVRGEPKQTVLLVADGGRQQAAAEAERLLAAGHRVVAVDPFYLGESKIPQRDFLFALLVAAVGERPLGVQASQLAAVARWLADQRQLGPVTIAAAGRRTGLAALVAAGLEEKAIGEAELRGSFGSLKQVIEENLSVDQAPELFCFGLLERFDIPQLAALVAPRPCRFPEPSDRLRKEVAPLAAWYALFDKPFTLPAE